MVDRPCDSKALKTVTPLFSKQTRYISPYILKYNFSVEKDVQSGTGWLLSH